MRATPLIKSSRKYLTTYKDNFNNVLEIGFNAGHSSELFLCSNPNSNVLSIDLGYWYYCKFGYEFLKKKYPNRINVIFKDSIDALSDYETIKENTFFDFIYIDGNHTYDYAYQDMINCKKFAKEDTIIILDDVIKDDNFRTLSNTAPTKVWNELAKEGFIIELDTAHFQDINRGVAVCKYNFDY